jgi:WhiB family redox-sensing transcriptional regulator
MAKNFKVAKPKPNLPSEWKEEGRCKTIDSKIFFSEIQAHTREALNACMECRVKDECRDYAIANQEHGVWGGTTERQRRAILRRMRFERKFSNYDSTGT